MSFSLIVVNNPKDWPLKVRAGEVIAARSYLTEPKFIDMRGVRAFNLCRSYRYQSTGYYVSLLAEARGHRPLPSITTIQDMKSLSIVRLISEDLDELIQSSLHPVQSSHFTLSIYFGRNLAKRHDKLSRHLFNLFQTPLLRAEFTKDTDGHWQVRSISPVSVNEIPKEHMPFVVEFAQDFFGGRMPRVAKRAEPRCHLAILHTPEDPDRPSNPRAIQRFVNAAQSLDVGVEVIGKSDFGRIAEFDALFIRDSTEVTNYTYRFARRAAAEGLEVIDSPESIFKCGNKVYLAELLNRHGLPTPKTLIIHKDNMGRLEREIGLPVILKQPDSTFSVGVKKIEDYAVLNTELEKLLKQSDLIIAQEYMPTEFDWRIGILDRQPLYVCKYHMARRHWQVIRHKSNGKFDSGSVEAMPVWKAPEHVIDVALKAANLIGDGLYGVDVKEINGMAHVIEVNDCPNIDAGCEDQVLGEDLYRRIMQVFLRRIEKRRGI